MGEVVQAPPRQLQPEEVEKFSFFLRDQSVYLRAAVAYYTNGVDKDSLLLRRRITLQWAAAVAFFIAGYLSWVLWSWHPLPVLVPIYAVLGIRSYLETKRLQDIADDDWATIIELERALRIVDSTLIEFKLMSMSPAMAWRKVSKVQSAIWDVRDRYLLDSAGIDSFVPSIQEEDLAKLTVKELTT